MPQDNILILDVLIARGPLAEAGILPALVGELTRGPELLVAVAGDPDGPGGEEPGALVEGFRPHHEHLAGLRVQLVAGVLARDGVGPGRVEDLVHPALGQVEVVPTRPRDRGRLHAERAAEGVELRVVAHGDGVVVHDGVLGVTV